MNLRSLFPILLLSILFFVSCQTDSTQKAGVFPIDEEIMARIMMLEDQRNPDMQILGEYLASSDKYVRTRACLALGRIGMLDKDDPFRKDLEEVLLNDDDEGVRAMAAFALGLAREAKSLTVLAKAAKDESPLVREKAVEAICLVGQAKEAKLVRIPLKEDESITVKRKILRASWRLRDMDLTNEVMAIIKDGPEELLWDATYHLSRSGLTRELAWTPELLEKLVNSEDPQVRKNAIKLLPNLQDREKLAQFFDTLLADADNNVRINAFRAAAQMAYPGLTDILIESMNSTSPQIRQEAVKAAATIIRIYKEAGSQDAANLEKLASVAQKGLEDKESDIVSESVRALLPVIDASGLAGKQEELLKDNRARVRAAAVNLIAFTEQEKAWDRIQEALKDEEAGVKIAAAQLLMRFQDERVPARVTEILKNEDPVMVSIAASFFQRTPLADALEPLIEAYKAHENDTDTEALSGIVAALGSYQGSEPAIETLKLALENKSRKVRLSAATILENIVEGVMDKVGTEDTGRDLEFYKKALRTVLENPVITLKTTKGDLVFRFHTGRATLTAYNIITLAQKGYFDGTTVHRVVPDFVAQMGDPMGTGWGGPGYSIRCEVNDLSYERGAVGMALSGKDTGGSQFFFTISPQPHLDGGYTIFGKTLKGMEVTETLLPGDKIIKAVLSQE